jgi:hypothetical protein
VSISFLLYLGMFQGQLYGRGKLLAFSLAVIPSLVAVLLTLEYAGRSNLNYILECYRTFGFQGGGSNKIYSVLIEIKNIIFRYGPSINQFSGMCYITVVGALMPLFYFAKSETPDLRRKLIFCWVSSWLFGLTYAYTSGNGAIALPFGLISGLMINFVFLSMTPRVSKLVVPIICASVIVYQIWFLYRNIYRDGPLSQMSFVMKRGAYAGLRTTSAKYKFLENLQRDLDTVLVGRKTIFWYDDFPAGYLLSNLRPLTPSMWIQGQSPKYHYDRHLMSRFFERSTERPDIVVRVLAQPFEQGVVKRAEPPNAADSLYAQFTDYKVVISNSDYEISVRE